MVKIGKPEITPPDVSINHEEYYCPFQIIGIGDEKIEIAYGVDSFQAMLLAMEAIGLQLQESDAYKEDKLTWCGELTNLGFPAFDSSGILADMDYPHFNQSKNEEFD